MSSSPAQRFPVRDRAPVSSSMYNYVDKQMRRDLQGSASSCVALTQLGGEGGDCSTLDRCRSPKRCGAVEKCVQVLRCGEQQRSANHQELSILPYLSTYVHMYVCICTVCMLVPGMLDAPIFMVTSASQSAYRHDSDQLAVNGR
jgi:hypothetical protein